MAIRTRSGGLQLDVSHTVNGEKIRHREAFHGTMAEAVIREAVIKAALMVGDDPAVNTSKATKHSKTKKKSKKKAALPLESTLETVWAKYWKGKGQAVSVRSHMRAAVDFFGPETCIRKITTSDIDGYIEHMALRDLSPSTINGRCAALSKMFRHCKRRKLIKDTPYFDKPSVGDNSRDRFLSIDEEKELLSIMRQDWDHSFKTKRRERIAGTHYADLFEFLIDTGIRPIEARHIHVKNLNGRNLKLVHTKNDERRVVPLTCRAEQAMKRLQTEFGDEPFAWADPSRIARGWNFARREMGFNKDPEFVPYSMRHTCATRLYDVTRDLLVVREWMGHKSLQITLRYAKLQPDDLTKACDRMQESLAA
jgi:site-specific recombinase XerD